VDWEPAADEPSLDITLTPSGPRDTSLMGW
jgi:hypothetical protein